VTGETARAAAEAAEATRGSAIKLAAEVASRLLTFATTLLVLRGLGASLFGRFTELGVYALLLAELGELGLHTLASRALVAGSLSLRALVRARLALAALVGGVAILAVPLAPRVLGANASPALSFLLFWFALSGWGEFLGVALRCRAARLQEAFLLLGLRGASLACAGAAILAGAGLEGVAFGLALSPVPAIVAGAVLLRHTPAPVARETPGPAAVLRESAPLAVHGGLLLLSPRVEFLVLTWLAAEAEAGFFAAGLAVIWFLAMVPSAVVAGAMPALTREALRGEGAGSVRRRTAGTLALLAAPATVGLALVATPVARLLLGPGYPAGGYTATAEPLALMAAALPAIFLNALQAAALVARGRAAWLPWLTAARVGAAFAFAFALVPRFGGMGAAAGLVAAEWLLLALAHVACRKASFTVPLARPLASALVACVPMALAVNGLRDSLPAAVLVGALTWAATLAAAARLAPGPWRQLLGGLRYP
jgi:O-antigen/teichoic acid export membrane protein